MAEIKITVSGEVGCGKSAILGEIEILMNALGVPVRYEDAAAAQAEKNMTHADWTREIEMYQPSVVLVEELQAARRQHGSAAQAVAQPFGYIVCEKTDAGTDEFIYRQAWDNISPEARAKYVIKTELFTAPPVAAEQPAAATPWLETEGGKASIAAAEADAEAYANQPDSFFQDVAGQPAAAGNALTDEQCDKVAAQAMDRVAVARGMHALEINADVREHHTLRRELVRAGAAIEQHLRAAPQAAPEWMPLSRAGQVKVGDKLRFTIGDKQFNQRAKQILHAGTDKEEVIYDKGRNFYFITSCVLSGWSNHKNVEVLAAHTRATDGKDAERYEYLIDCDYRAAKKYLPALDEAKHKQGLRAKHDAAMQRAASTRPEGGA